MKVINVRDLKPQNRLKFDLYHSSGELLLPKDEGLDEVTIALLKDCSIRNLIQLGPKDSPVELRSRVRNRPVSVDELEKGELVSTSVFDQDGNLLIDQGVRISASIIAGLRRRKLDVIFIALSDDELKMHQVHAFRRSFGKYKLDSLVNPVKVEIRPSLLLKGPSQATEQYLDTLIESADSSLRVETTAHPVTHSLQMRNELIGHTLEEKEAYLAIHREAMLQTEEMFQKMVRGGVIDGKGISATGREIVSAIMYDAPLLINIALLKTRSDYLKGHSIAVGILAANIGTALGYSKEQVFELSYGALLHDVGMLKVPKAIVDKKGPLTASERREVNKHPIYGIEILQKMRGIPRSTPLVAYQSHERLDGRGYPKRRSAMLRHDFAKIIAVCDVYEALTSERPYRPAFLPYKAMEYIILHGNQGVFDPKIIKAFLQQVSLFPVGSWVELAGGEKAKVVATNKQDYTKPVLSIVGDTKGFFKQPERVSMLEDKKIKIARAIDGSEFNTEIMYGF